VWGMKGREQNQTSAKGAIMQLGNLMRGARTAFGFSRRQMLGGIAGATVAVESPPARATPRARPNVILIMADDMRADDLGAMPAVQALLVEEGTTFEQCLTATPGCAPSRATLLRGQYPHNHGVMRGSGRLGGFGRFREMGNEVSTLATWLQDAGYHTALIGKYLNEYPIGAAPNHIPPGWDEWVGATKGGYVGFELNDNGELIRYRKRDAIYQTDVLAAKATDFIARAAQAEDPFFLYVAPRAPHGPATPAPRHEGLFTEETAPRRASFDEVDVSDKPRWLQQVPALDNEQVAKVDATYRARMESLQALDELIADLITILETAGALQDTYIVFTSDHGYHLGEHRIVEGKGTPYEEAIRVPLVMRGPGVPRGRTAALASIVDLAPTVAGWAGADVPDFVDGRSLEPVLIGEPADWRNAVLVEHHHGRPNRTDGPPAFKALRADGLAYVEYADGWRELYDLETDPHQLDNRVTEADPHQVDAFAAGLADLAECAGRSCRTAEDAVLAT
jgi:N-acetylglucosamine-6-sulfatase